MWQVQVITYVVQTGAEEKRAEVVEGGAGVELSHSGRRGSGRSSPYSFPPLTTSIHTETQQGRGFPLLVTSLYDMKGFPPSGHIHLYDRAWCKVCAEDTMGKWAEPREASHWYPQSTIE